MTDYIIIDLRDTGQLFNFRDITYYLSHDEVKCLKDEGILLLSEKMRYSKDVQALQINIAQSLGIDTSNDFLGILSNEFYCHRCHGHFYSEGSGPVVCPFCHADSWNLYTLLYCSQCHALFESYWPPQEEVKPYDRFPRCPACKSEHWCPKEEAQAKRQIEAEAFTRLMEARKQQQLKKLGLGSPSRRAEERGAAIPEAEAYYRSAERTSHWLNKGARPVQPPSLLQPSTRVSPPPIHQPSASVADPSAPAPQQQTAVPRRGLLSFFQNWFRRRHL